MEEVQPERFPIPLAILLQPRKQALKTFIFLLFIAPPTAIRQCTPIRTFRNRESGELRLTEGLAENLIRLQFRFCLLLLR